MLTLILGLLLIQFGGTPSKDCYPITANDLHRKNAPDFAQYAALERLTSEVAPVDLNSSSLARRFRTVLRQGATEGPNFAGIYTVVGWGCGSSCVSFAIINNKTGKVIAPSGINSVSGVELHADDFEPHTNSKYWGLRFKLDSKLLIVVGAINEDEKREGAFYYLLENEKLKPIFSILTKKTHC
jgi:hypothetical protein